MNFCRILQKRRRRPGITGRTALLSWMVSAVTLLIFVAVILPEQKQALLHNLDSKAHGVAVSVREVMSGAVNEDYSSVVDHCMELLKGDPAIEYVVITKNDGFSLIHQRTGWTSETTAPREWRPSKRVASSGIGIAPYFNSRGFHFSQPFDYSGIEWGWIHVGLSLESYDANVRNVTQRTAWLALLCIVISFAASVLYARRLLGPILNLRNAVVKVASGDLTARASVQGSDEVSSLAQSFNQMTEGLLQRDNILQSVRFVAEKFLTSSDWRLIVPEVIARIGQASNASRMGVFQNDPSGSGEMTASRAFVWAAPGVLSDAENPLFRNVSWHRAGFGVQAEALANGELITCDTAELSAAARIYLDPYGTKSVMFAPIMAEGRWWGALAVSDVRAQREWTPAEVTSIRAVADMLGAAISRQRTQDALREAKEKAEAASQAKSQFLANMSHEIRTPITGVMGMLELLKLTETNPKQSRYVHQALDSANTLLAVIGDVLDFSKIEAGRLELAASDFSLREVVDGAVHLFAGRAEQKGIELLGRVDPKLADEYSGDANRLRQILVNLMGNALKFTARGEVVLACWLEHTEPKETSVRFEVRDTGCGIALEDQKLIFEAFSQADNSMTRAHGGTGLGLAISRQLCELMGGMMGVESEPGRGSTFWLTIKLKPAAAPQRESSVQRAHDLRKLPILVADGSATMREFMREQVQAWNGEAMEAADAQAALEQLRAAAQRGQPFAVAVLDAKLPGENGLALAERIRADDALKDTGLVLLTHFAQELNDDDFGRFAASVAKPLRCSEFYVAVAAAANGSLSGHKVRPAPIVEVGQLGSALVTEPEVLLAEDNEINREVVTELLTHLGYRWRCVVTGRQAVDAVKAGQASLVLMDCQMPEMDGYQASRAIRAGELAGGRRIPIIALTAHATSGDREQCLAAGMDDYLTKPIDPELLRGKLRRWLGAGAPATNHSARKNPEFNGCPPEAPSRNSENGFHATWAEVATGSRVVDYDLLLGRCQGKRSLADKLLAKLAEQGHTDEAEIRVALNGQDVARVVRAAHRLKGAAANVAANPLRQVAFQIETAARAGRLNEIPALLHELEFDLQQLAAIPRQHQLLPETV